MKNTQGDKMDRLKGLEIKLAEELGGMWEAVCNDCFCTETVRSGVWYRLRDLDLDWLCYDCWRDNGERHRGEI